MRVSAVVPTCNRPASLLRAVASLTRQTHRLEEIIVVDASDEPLEPRPSPGETELQYVRSSASVCRQRNVGIARARGDYVLLCDDDVELPETYVATLSDYAAANGAVAASGLFLQRDAGGEWSYQYPVSSFRRLLWAYVFQLSLWGEIRCRVDRAPARWLYERMLRDYARRGNSVTRAGWPLVTQFRDDVIRTRVYSLGAALVRKTWLVSHPFDEVLDRHGIGDNYGVTIDLPGGVHVLKAARAYHYSEPGNRLSRDIASFRRTLALDYFLSSRGTPASRLFLRWSLCGALLGPLFGNTAGTKAAFKSLWLMSTGRNPYLRAKAQGRSVVEPQL